MISRPELHPAFRDWIDARRPELAPAFRAWIDARREDCLRLAPQDLGWREKARDVFFAADLERAANSPGRQRRAGR